MRIKETKENEQYDIPSEHFEKERIAKSLEITPKSSSQKLAKNRSLLKDEGFKISKSDLIDVPLTFFKNYKRRIRPLLEKHSLSNIPQRFDCIISDTNGSIFAAKHGFLTEFKLDSTEGLCVFSQPKEGFEMITDFTPRPDDKSWTQLLALQKFPLVSETDSEPIKKLFNRTAIVCWTKEALELFSPISKFHFEIKHEFCISAHAFGYFGQMVFYERVKKAVFIFDYLNNSAVRAELPSELICQEMKIYATREDIFIFGPKYLVRVDWTGKLIGRKHIGAQSFALAGGRHKVYFLARKTELDIYDFKEKNSLVSKLTFDGQIVSLSMTKDSERLFILTLDKAGENSKIDIYELTGRQISRQLSFSFKINELVVSGNGSVLFYKTAFGWTPAELDGSYVDSVVHIWNGPTPRRERRLEADFKSSDSEVPGLIHSPYAPAIQAFHPLKDEILFILDRKLYCASATEFVKSDAKMSPVISLAEKIGQPKIHALHDEILIDHGNNHITLLNLSLSPKILNFSYHVIAYKKVKKMYKRNFQRRTTLKDLIDLEKISSVSKRPKQKAKNPQTVIFIDKSVKPALYLFFSIENKILFFLEELTRQPTDLMPMDVQILEGTVNRSASLLFARQKNDTVCVWDLQIKQKIRHIAHHIKRIYRLPPSENFLYLYTKKKTLDIFSLEGEKPLVKSARLKKFIIYGLPPDDVKAEVDGQRLRVLVANQTIELRVNLRLTLFETQFIQSLLSKNKTYNEQKFIKMLNKFRPVYEASVLLHLYFNPLIVAAIKGFAKAILYLLQTKLVRYPELNKEQMSPLTAAFLVGDVGSAEALCNYLAASERRLFLLQDEIEMLIFSESAFAKTLLASQMYELHKYEFSSETLITKGFLPGEISVLTSPCQFFTPSIADQLLGIKEECAEAQIELRAKKSLEKYQEFPEEERLVSFIERPSALRETENQVFSPNQLNLRMLNSESSLTNKEKARTRARGYRGDRGRALSYYRIAGEVDLREGSVMSYAFLCSYKQTQNFEFVLSNWRLVIDYKWRKYLRFYLAQGFANFVQTMLLTYYFFNPRHTWAFLCEMILLVVFFLYELISFCLSPLSYFEDVDNLFDFFCVLLGNGVMVGTFVFSRTRDPDEDSNDGLIVRSFQVLAMFVFYYRVLSYLKSVDYFRHIIAMLIAVSIDVLDVLVIVTLATIGFALMYAKSNIDPSLSLGDCLINSFLAVYSTLPTSSNKSYIDWFLTIIMGFFSSLILVNFLIAKMSNKYTLLENSQIALSYREKARIILEFELWHRWLFGNHPSPFKARKPVYFYLAASVSQHPASRKREEKEEEAAKNFERKNSEAGDIAAELKKLVSQSEERILGEIQDLRKMLGGQKKEFEKATKIKKSDDFDL